MVLGGGSPHSDTHGGLPLALSHTWHAKLSARVPEWYPNGTRQVTLGKTQHQYSKWLCFHKPPCLGKYFILMKAQNPAYWLISRPSVHRGLSGNQVLSLSVRCDFLLSLSETQTPLPEFPKLSWITVNSFSKVIKICQWFGAQEPPETTSKGIPQTVWGTVYSKSNAQCVRRKQCSGAFNTLYTCVSNTIPITLALVTSLTPATKLNKITNTEMLSLSTLYRLISMLELDTGRHYSAEP